MSVGLAVGKMVGSVGLVLGSAEGANVGTVGLEVGPGVAHVSVIPKVN